MAEIDDDLMIGWPGQSVIGAPDIAPQMAETFGDVDAQPRHIEELLTPAEIKRARGALCALVQPAARNHAARVEFAYEACKAMIDDYGRQQRAAMAQAVGVGAGEMPPISVTVTDHSRELGDMGHSLGHVVSMNEEDGDGGVVGSLFEIAVTTTPEVVRDESSGGIRAVGHRTKTRTVVDGLMCEICKDLVVNATIN